MSREKKGKPFKQELGILFLERCIIRTLYKFIKKEWFIIYCLTKWIFNKSIFQIYSRIFYI